MTEAAVNFLLRAQNSDGGWGAEQGRSSSSEATAFALLGLRATGQRAADESIRLGINWLTTRQNRDGSWPLNAGLQEGSWATAPASLAASTFETHRERALKGASWLVHQEGRQPGWLMYLLYRFAPGKLAVRLDPGLKGWAWTPGTFSWVEPTAYALIALKKLKPNLADPQADERVRQGERLLYDRMCAGGGWNYGNSKVFGEDLPPYPDTTALALIALQTERARDANQLSVKTLKLMLEKTQSGLALGWSILCLSIYGHDVSELRKRLVASYAKTGFLGETRSVSLALLALANRPTVFHLRF